jgi:hypothetical protein
LSLDEALGLVGPFAGFAAAGLAFPGPFVLDVDDLSSMLTMASHRSLTAASDLRWLSIAILSYPRLST